MLLKITESRPRKSAVSPVYSSPPEEGQGRNADQLSRKCSGNTERVRVSDLWQQHKMVHINCSNQDPKNTR